MLVSFLIKMLYILVLCRVMLIAGVQTLTIDSQLGTSIEDCFERISIGNQLPTDAIYRNVSELTNRECEQICKQDKKCQAYDYGVGAKGNATCNLSTLDEKTIKDEKPLKRHPDYDIYIRRFQCEQSPPTPIQPLSDDPGPQPGPDGPQHRPVFRPEVDERPSAGDYLVSGDLEYGKPQFPYRPDDASSNKPDYNAPPSYGDHRPPEIPYRPSRPNDLNRPERPSDPFGPERPNDPYSPAYGDRPQDQLYGSDRPHEPPYRPSRPNDRYKPARPDSRPESNDVLQFQGIPGKPRPPADEYPRPDPYRPEKPNYHYIIRPNRKPRPQDDYPSSSYGQSSGPIGPPDRPYKPTRPYDKPTYSYQSQYASNFGQNTQNDNSLYVEIHDPPRPYIPIKDRPNQQYNGQGYLGYGTYSSQNSHSQFQNDQYLGSITEIGGSYGQNDRPYDRPQKPPPYRPPVNDDRPQKPGYGIPDDDRPEKPGYGLADQRPSKPVYGSSSDNGYGNPGFGQRPDDYEKPLYGQGSYGGSQGGYGGYKGSSNNNKGSYSSSQTDYPSSQGGYGGNRPASDYGETGYGQSQRPNDYNKPSYGSQNSHKGSYSNSYNEQSSHQGSYGSQSSYETHRPSLDNSHDNYGKPEYQKPHKPIPAYDKPYDHTQDSYGANQGAYGGTHSNTQSSYGSSSSSYGSSQGSYGTSQGSYGSGQGTYSTNQGSYGGTKGSYGSSPGYGHTSSNHGYGSSSYGESQYADHSTYGGYGNRPSQDQRPGYGNDRPDYSNRPDFDYERPSYGQKPSSGYHSQTTGYGEKPNYESQTSGYGQKPKPGYNDPKPGYNDPKPGYNDPKPGYNDPKPGYNDPKPGYDEKPDPPDTDYRPNVKPVYEYEVEKPNNVPTYIVKPGGEVVTSRPMVIGDYERPVYKEPGSPGKHISYKGFRNL